MSSLCLSVAVQTRTNLMGNNFVICARQDGVHGRAEEQWRAAAGEAGRSKASGIIHFNDGDNDRNNCGAASVPQSIDWLPIMTN